MTTPARQPLGATLLGSLLAAALALGAAGAPAYAADEDAPLQSVVDAAKAEGKPIPADEFNTVIAPFFEVEKSDVGAHQVALETADAKEGHQLLVRQVPGSQESDIVMGFATRDSITGFLTSENGKLRDVMRRVRGQDPEFQVTEEIRALFDHEKRFWQAWVKAEKK